MGYPAVLSAALSNTWISANIRTASYKRAVLMAVLAGQTMMNSNSDETIGRPGAQLALSGAPISEADRETMRNMQSYTWGVQAVVPNTAATAPAYGNMPTNATSTTTANSQVRANVTMPWTGVMQALNQVWKNDLDYAIAGKETDSGIGVAVTKVQENAAKSCMQDLLNLIVPQFHTGAPSGWGTNQMDQIAGFVTVCGTGIYAGATRVGGSALVSHTINATTGAGADDGLAIANDPVTLVNKINGTAAGVIFIDDPIDFVLTDYVTYINWKNSIIARGQVVQMTDLPQTAKVGVKKDFLQVDGRTNLTWDVTTNGMAANSAECYSLKEWLFVTHPDYNFTSSDLVDWSIYSPAAPRSFASYCEVKPMLVCHKPATQAYVTNLQN